MTEAIITAKNATDPRQLPIPTKEHFTVVNRKHGLYTVKVIGTDYQFNVFKDEKSGIWYLRETGSTERFNLMSHCGFDTRRNDLIIDAVRRIQWLVAG